MDMFTVRNMQRLPVCIYRVLNNFYVMMVVPSCFYPRKNMLPRCKRTRVRNVNAEKINGFIYKQIRYALTQCESGATSRVVFAEQILLTAFRVLPAARPRSQNLAKSTHTTLARFYA